MKKNKLLVCFLIFVLTLSLCACDVNINIGGSGEPGVSIGSPEKTPEVPNVPEIPDVPETPDVPEIPEVPEIPDVPEIPEVPEVPEIPEIPEVPETPEVPVVSTGISDNWEDMEFIFEGVKCKIGETSYMDLVSMGWTFNISDYGYDNGYILNPRDKVSGTIDLNHSKYGTEYNSFKITVGMVNNDTVAKDITLCDIWCFNVDSRYGFKLRDAYSDITIAKGIHFGSSEAEVLVAFGTPDDTYESVENGYKVYTWNSEDYSKYLRITVYTNGGVSAIELKSY